MTDAYYQPEAGQICFGKTWQRFDVPDLLDAALRMIAQEIGIVLSNRMQRQVQNPFDRWATSTFDTEGLSVHGYSSVSEDEVAPWNLKCGDVEVSWYKGPWRGLSVNRQLTNDDIATFLDRALSILRACDSDIRGDKGEQPFFYNGEEVAVSVFEMATRAREARRAARDSGSDPKGENAEGG